jgi:hypothetical protein
MNDVRHCFPASSSGAAVSWVFEWRHGQLSSIIIMIQNAVLSKAMIAVYNRRETIASR